MNRLLAILIIVIFVSCQNKLEFCKEHDEREIKWTNTIYSSSPQKELLPLSKLDGLIQYHGTDSWGWFKHTIRVIEKNENFVIQLYYSRKNSQSRTTDRVYQESILTEQQYKLLKNRIDKLICKPVNLETSIGIDGDFYELILKTDNKLQAFKWQSIFRNRTSEELKLIKTEVTYLVGELMNMSKFPNGSKQVVIGRNKETADSIKVEVFLAYQFNMRKSRVYLDDKLINQDKDGLAQLTIHKRDTIGIKERIKIEVELLNGETIEM